MGHALGQFASPILPHGQIKPVRRPKAMILIDFGMSKRYTTTDMIASKPMRDIAARSSIFQPAWARSLIADTRFSDSTNGSIGRLRGQPPTLQIHGISA